MVGPSYRASRVTAILDRRRGWGLLEERRVFVEGRRLLELPERSVKAILSLK